MTERKLYAGLESPTDGRSLNFPLIANVKFLDGVLDVFVDDLAYYRLSTDLKNVTLHGHSPRRDFEEVGIKEGDRFRFRLSEDNRVIPVRASRGHLPDEPKFNEETLEAFRELEAGRGTQYASLEEFFLTHGI